MAPQIKNPQSAPFA